MLIPAYNPSSGPSLGNATEEKVVLGNEDEKMMKIQIFLKLS
jgi:hypothetical protein